MSLTGRHAEGWLGYGDEHGDECKDQVNRSEGDLADLDRLEALERARSFDDELEHRQAKYLNNRIESDHGKLKRLIRPTLGFQSMRTARATTKGFEVMRMFKKGQFSLWIEAVAAGTEAGFVNRLFGFYARAGYKVSPSRVCSQSLQRDPL